MDLSDVENEPNNPANWGSFPRRTWQRFKGNLFNINSALLLPRQRQDASRALEFGVCPPRMRNSASNMPDHVFVLMCIPFRIYGTKLQQMDSCDIKSDREFFQALRYYYRTKRGGSIWAPLRKVTSINFVKVREPSVPTLEQNKCVGN